MSRRLVAPVVGAVPAGAGGLPPELAAAMLEDVVDLLAEMQQVEAAIVATPAAMQTARAAAWPSMPVVAVAEPVGLAAALAALQAAGADQAALVAPDAPDLPALLLGKLFSALTTAEVAVCPAAGGGIVAVAAALPPPAWLAAAPVDLSDGDDAVARLRAAAPSARSLHVGPGWHRVRGRGDLNVLDPGLEGWEATRAWVAANVST